MNTVTCPCCNIQVEPQIYTHDNTTHGSKLNGLYIHHDYHANNCTVKFIAILYDANRNINIGNQLTLVDTDIQIFQENINKAYQIFILKEF